MKKQFWKRSVCAGFISCLSLGILGGCGNEKTVDYAIEGMESTQQVKPEEAETDQPNSEAAQSRLAQFEEGEVWKETWQTKMIERKRDGDIVEDVEVNINAKITLPNVTQMSVVEVTEPTFDAEFKETVAENIFESGEIYYGDVTHLPKKDLEALDEYWSKERTIYFDSSLDYIELNRLQANMWDCIRDIENAPDTYTPVTEYTEDEYIGTYEDRMYNLTFTQTTGDEYEDSNYSQLKRVKCTVKDLYEVCPEKFKEQEELTCSPWMRGDWIDNQCEISEEEALKEAKKFAEQLGLDYPVYSYSRPLLWGMAPDNVTKESETDDWGINGYVFYFDLGADDLSFVNYGVEEEYWDFWVHADEEEEIHYSLDSHLQIYVTNQGVIRAIANNPMEITALTEGVELLPLDTVKSIMKQAMSEQYEILRLNDYITTYNGMELIYFRVRDKENPGNYSYVPTWRLGYVTKDNILHKTSVRNPVLINAIDGSLIDFYDET